MFEAMAASRPIVATDADGLVDVLTDEHDAIVVPKRNAQALDTVQRFLAQPGLEPDLRLKLLEAVDGLERTVKVRGRYSN